MKFSRHLFVNRDTSCFYSLTVALVAVRSLKPSVPTEKLLDILFLDIELEALCLNSWIDKSKSIEIAMRVFFVCFFFIALIVTGIVDLKIMHMEYGTFSEKVLQLCQKSIGLRYIPRVGKKRFNQDCIGFCDYIYFQAGVDLKRNRDTTNNNLTESIVYGLRKKGYCYQIGKPSPADLILFDNTYDFNRNGKWDDPYTHVGIVLGMDEDGTVEFIHYTRGLVKKGKVNLIIKDTNKLNGKEINSYLRNRFYPVKELTNYLACQFFHEYARVRPDWEK